ncbi:unnamed protein product, partial [Ascophyllum nodosum]
MESDSQRCMDEASGCGLDAEPDSGRSPGVDALLLALVTACDAEPWFVTMRHLQVACVDLCVACRTSTTWHVSVTTDTPRYLW